MKVTIPPWVFSSEQARAPLPSSVVHEGDEFQSALRAQGKEDIYAHEHFFRDKSGGLILESGALDGLTFSVSHFFVKARGWRAIHVEGSPKSYEALVRNRPESLNVHAAICTQLTYLHFAEKLVDPAGGGSTAGFWEFMSDHIKSSYWSELKSAADVDTLPMVPCRRLSSILALFAISHIDLWILDMEGAEMEALNTFDFSAVTVDVIAVELDGSNPVKDAEVRAFILSKKYDLFDKADMNNDWYVRKGFVRESEKARRLKASGRLASA
jgi:hypothetical protein